jgi:hypothetical protein
VGSFSPSATALNAIYVPSSAEIAAGGVILTLTSNDPAGPCGAASDAMRITITPATTVDAGSDQTECSASPQVALSGRVGGTVSNGTWSGGAGSFSPSASSLSASYTPSASEIASGHVTLTLTSATPNGPCPAASDAMNITILPAATVSAGADQVVCPASPQVQLAGSYGGGASGATWSGGTGSFNPNASSLSAIYTPSAAEIAAGGVTLTLTTNDPAGPCGVASDAMRITVDAPRVTVADRIVCTGVSPVTLCATASSGVAPYAYLWSNGAKTSCITVADTGSYAVTITDAKGCTAGATGAYRQRDCQGQLTHTTATCETFMAGTASDFSSADVNVVLKDNVITSISPGVFFYWSKITAPSSDFTVNVAQSRSDTRFPFLPVLQVQVTLFDANCNNIGTGAEPSPGQAAIAVHGSVPGKAYIVCVKYSLKQLVGVYMDSTMGVQYGFRTMINGQVVDSDPDGLHIGAATTPSAELGGDTGGPGDGMRLLNPTSAQPGLDESPALDDGLREYRPTPNPFHADVRMAYVVSRGGQAVSIRMYDLSGRLVRSLVDGPMGAGRHVATWDAHDDQGARVRAGMYFVRFRIGDQVQQVRVTFVQ